MVDWAQGLHFYPQIQFVVTDKFLFIGNEGIMASNLCIVHSLANNKKVTHY